MLSWLAVKLPMGALRLAAVGAGVGLLIAAAAAANVPTMSVLAADAPVLEHTITVTATGRVTLTPDIADLRLGVNVTRPTAIGARNQAAAAMTKVVDAIRRGGVADKDIQTALLSLQPVYDYSKNAQGKLTGFQVVNIVAVTVRDIGKAGAIVDASVTAGATSIDGVSFRVEDETKAESNARTAAVADAHARANELAAAAGVTITGVSSIAEVVTSVPYPTGGGAPSAADHATPVQPGNAEIDVSVTVVYRIG